MEPTNVIMSSKLPSGVVMYPSHNGRLKSLVLYKDIGGKVGYQWGNGKYEAAAFGRNITNQVRAVGGIDFNNLTGFINDPRTWGAQFRMTF